VAASGLLKKLVVEGGVAAKARAAYAALFTADPAAAASSSSGSPPDSPREGAGEPAAAANGSSGSSFISGAGAKLGPGIAAAAPLLAQLAGDAPGQLAQLVALEWLLTVSVACDLGGLGPWLSVAGALAFCCWCSCQARLVSPHSFPLFTTRTHVMHAALLLPHHTGGCS
jgi:hypothetical protein